ncbi:MAG: HesA/MoeB/ThiF family protein [Chitinophagia bacterium]|jgi:adenylyltransferase/sulfurtransferase|nr:HesA/MoeB/ThiF family protein [Chitinophagia bacterium]NCA30550.1 HesA/MoeB/ThiF family protein [Chitinophagia bacterium]
MEKSKEYILRYQRQIILNGFGIEAQEKITSAKVLVIGAGGLGCPILQYLVAVGVGVLGVVDNDQITLSNLNRQILFGQEDIGKNKAITATQKLIAQNNLVKINPYAQHCNQTFALEIFPKYDIIVDATDNFATRYLINDACVLLKKPLVFGAVSQFEGQVAVFNVIKNGQSFNYRDLFPVPPKSNEVLSCSEGGVLGVLPGIIGMLQAMEVIKLITGIGALLANELLTYNALRLEYYKMQIVQHPKSEKNRPTTLEAFTKLNYEWLCN